MSIASIDFISAASDISSIGNEAAFRSSVSRAYYGAFNECKESAAVKLAHSGHKIFSQSSHENLFMQMLDEPLKSGWRSVAYVMQDFKKERVESDYHLKSSTVTHSDAMNAIARANMLVKSLSKIP